MSAFDDRKSFTDKKKKELKEALKEAERFLGGANEDEWVACVYATGSYGRGEASQHSDLDAFIAGLPAPAERDRYKGGRALSRLDEICLKADLVSGTRAVDLPEFDGDGEYLRHYTIDELVTTLGKPEDDVQNTFTARLLLLLESAPLLGENVYKRVIEEVVASYWRDYDDHRDDFIPTFLVNDILRLWRTLCVGYEAKTKPAPAEEKSKRRLKNYKLRHSRILTCYSTILQLLAIIHDRRTVSPQDMIEIALLPPLNRVGNVSDLDPPDETKTALERICSAYERFLENTNASNDELKSRFLNDSFHADRKKEAGDFSEAVFDAVMSFGRDNPLLRRLVV